MALWPLLTIICSAVAVALSYPLIRRYESSSQRALREVAIYSDQVKEVEADVEAGNISVNDAAQATAEIQRRQTVASKNIEAHHPLSFGWRNVALVSTAALIILGSVNLYSLLGRPDLNKIPSKPDIVVPVVSENTGATQTTPAPVGNGAGQVSDMVTKLAARLKSNPNDAEGWRMLGWSYFNLRNFGEAASAYKKATDLEPNNMDYKSAFAEALVQSTDGMVTPQAQALIAEVLAKEPKEQRARFYDALAREQAGDQQGALDRWLSLLADSPPDAGWREDVKARIADLGKATGRDVSGAISLPNLQPTEGNQPLGQAEKNAMVDGMIAKLAAKLETNPKDRDGWAMMIRSLNVRGDKAGAEKALADALAIFKDDAVTIEGLKNIANGNSTNATGNASAIPPGAAAPDLNTVDQNTKAAVEAMAPEDQQQMIKGMVAKLAAKLDASPNDSDGWIRLMRSYMVLKDSASAKAALDKAMAVFANDSATHNRLMAAAAELGVK
jgi:cytochrome c-type biogenesis protein CcmH